MGRCDACNAWNAIVEEVVDAPPVGRGGARGGAGGGRALDFSTLQGTSNSTARRKTGIAEFDRVTGGGLVEGSVLLIGGDPGIGKSTLLLQVAAQLGQSARVAYISGEEAIDQVRLRASRLGVATAPVDLAAATNVRDIAATLDSENGPQVVIVDSIQTMYMDVLESAPGTVAQVRASAQELIRIAKRRGITVMIVGHVTKEGTIAGPRVLEHMVDTVLYFEGERGHQFRILRAVKNRFGPTDEIGVFEMTDGGLIEVANPSALFLAERQGDVSGAAVFAGIEGSRPVLVEIQALVAPSPLATPRRTVVGWDGGRLAMIIAVLETRAGLSLSGRDVYLNVAGGMRIGEPAADLAVAAALVSSVSGVALPTDTVVFGEIGLSGEVRGVTRSDARIKEAGKLGFGKVIMPARRARERSKQARQSTDLEVSEVTRLSEIVDLLAAKSPGQRQAISV